MLLSWGSHLLTFCKAGIGRGLGGGAGDVAALVGHQALGPAFPR